MNLRQIIRNQKLQNFNLSSLIKEASKYEKFISQKISGLGGKQVTIGTALNYATHDDFQGRQDKVKVYNDALATIQSGVESGELESKNIPQDVKDAGVKRKSPEPEETPQADPDEEEAGAEDFDDDLETMQDFMADQPMPDEEADDEGDEERETVTADLNPATEPKNAKEINEFMRKTKLRGDGRSPGWAPTTAKMQRSGKIDINNTPQGNPPSDAVARQTAFDTGFPKKGTTPWPRSEVTGQDAAPAPGNPGSMMNEVFSVEGCNIAEEFYEQFGTTPTVDDIENILQQQFGKTQLAEDNGGPSSDDYRKKLRIAAEASVTKFDRLKNGEAANANTDPPFGKMIRPPSEFYGAGDSLEAQAAMIRGLDDDATIFGPDGPITEITDSPRTREELEAALEAVAKKGLGGYGEFATGDGKTKKITDENRAAIKVAVEKMIKNNDVKQFAELLAYAGGGGANPSDTATFAQSEDGNLMILFHSDKMSTSDQQANSTLPQEARRQEAYLRELMDSKPPQLSKDDLSKAKEVLDEFSETLKETSEENDSSGVAQAALNLTGKGQQEALLKALAANPKRPPTIGSRPAQKVSAEEFLKHFSNPNNVPTKDQSKLFRDIKENLKKSGDDELFSEDETDQLDTAFVGAERTKRVVGAIQDRLAALDKLETNTDPPIKVGQLIETKNIIDKLHLYAMNDPSSLAYQSGMCATVIGGDVVNKDVLRSIFGVDSAEELIGKVKVGAAGAPEGDWVDESVGSGVPNSLLQRSRDTFRKVDGQVQYFTVGKDGKINGMTSDPEDENIQTAGTGKNKKPVKVGVVTGQKSLFYAVDAHGEDCNFAGQAARSKEGAGAELQTAYVYGPCMKEGISKYGKEPVKNESIRYFGDILDELKQNTLGHHWMKAEENYPAHYFIRELNEGSLN